MFVGEATVPNFRIFARPRAAVSFPTCLSPRLSPRPALPPSLPSISLLINPILHRCQRISPSVSLSVYPSLCPRCRHIHPHRPGSPLSTHYPASCFVGLYWFTGKIEPKDRKGCGENGEKATSDSSCHTTDPIPPEKANWGIVPPLSVQCTLPWRQRRQITPGSIRTIDPLPPEKEHEDIAPLLSIQYRSSRKKITPDNFTEDSVL